LRSSLPCSVGSGWALGQELPADTLESCRVCTCSTRAGRPSATPRSRLARAGPASSSHRSSSSEELSYRTAYSPSRPLVEATRTGFTEYGCRSCGPELLRNARTRADHDSEHPPESATRRTPVARGSADPTGAVVVGSQSGSAMELVSQHEFSIIDLLRGRPRLRRRSARSTRAHRHSSTQRQLATLDPSDHRTRSWRPPRAPAHTTDGSPPVGEC
jgi:hypothetical protein